MYDISHETILSKELDGKLEYNCDAIREGVRKKCLEEVEDEKDDEVADNMCRKFLKYGNGTFMLSTFDEVHPDGVEIRKGVKNLKMTFGETPAGVTVDVNSIAKEEEQKEDESPKLLSKEWCDIYARYDKWAAQQCTDRYRRQYGN